MAAAARYPVVVFDLDGTLLPNTSVSLLLAQWMGHGEAIGELERRFRAGQISNREVAEVSAGWFAGVEPSAVWAELEGAPWIEGIDETVAALAEVGCQILLGTVTWRFAAEPLRERHGLDAASGTEMELDGGRLSGRVSRHFDEFDKLGFVAEWCEAHGFGLEQVAAVGDSRSDLPLFEQVGFAIALNATADARTAADLAIDTERLTDVLEHLLDPEPGDGRAGCRVMPA